MHTFSIRTHLWKSTYQAPHFFIQSKGNHAGRPLREPMRNSFVVCASSTEASEELFWLCQALYQASRFHLLLRGSVIPFLLIRDVKTLLSQSLEKSKKAKVSISKTALVMRQVEEVQANYRKIIELLEKQKQVHIRQLIT